MRRSRKDWLAAFPEEPEEFRSAVMRACAQVRAESGSTRADCRRKTLRPVAVLVAAALLLAGSTAVAAGLRLGLLDYIKGTGGGQPLPKAQSNLAKNLAARSLPHVDLAVRSAIYDGATLHVEYAIRLRDAARPLTEQELWNPESTFSLALDADGVRLTGGDFFRIDGQDYAMTDASGGRVIPGDNAGEALGYLSIQLPPKISRREGTTRFGLMLAQEPLVFDLPVCEALDITPNSTESVGNLNVEITRARLTPLKTYTEWTVRVQPGVEKTEALEALERWAGARLVDAAGQPLCQTRSPAYLPDVRAAYLEDNSCSWACTGEALAQVPDEIYFAPGVWNREAGWCARMDEAVRLR